MPRYKLEWYDDEHDGWTVLRNSDLETVQFLTEHLLSTGQPSVVLSQETADCGRSEPLTAWERELKRTLPPNVAHPRS